MAKIIGLTGGIAMGKSTATAHILSRGFKVVDTDKIVHELQAKDSKLYKILVAHFGRGILDPILGEINRKTLNRIAFKENRLEELTEVQMPTIKAEIRKRIAELSKTEKVIFLDAATLFENDLDELCDEIWTIHCSESNQINRLKKRNKLNRTGAIKRIKSQMRAYERIYRADKVISNNQSVKSFLKEVNKLLSKL